MKIGKRDGIRRIVTVIDVVSVPAAAAVVGWLIGPNFTLRMLDFFGMNPQAQQALSSSTLFNYGMQVTAAALLFALAWRYLT